VKYRKKPITIEARQFDGTQKNATEIINWVLDGGGTARWRCADQAPCSGGDENHTLVVDTLEGTMKVGTGWWVIQGVKGEFYPCADEVFEAGYDSMESLDD